MSGQTAWLPYCGAAPGPAEWLARWNLDPVLLLALLAAIALMLRQRRSSSRAGLWAQGGAIFLVALLFVSPLCALGSALFTARVIHHVLLATALAALLVSATGLHRRRISGSLPLWTALQALTFWAWHAPPLYAAALSNDAVFWLMQLSITGSAALWWAKLRQAEAGAAVVALLATMVLMGILGALITFAGRALYAPHWLTTQAWGLSPLEDQQIAGIVMWAPASAIYLLTAMAILYRAIGRDPVPRGSRMIKGLQDWSQSFRDRGKYTPVGVAFHWIMAGLVLYQLGSGWLMQREMVGAEKLNAYQLHSEIGLTLLLLGVLRLAWRLIVPGPINDADRQGWRTTVAHAIHVAFYALFVVLPISGWMMWSAIQPAEPLYLAGLVPVPSMPFADLSPEWQHLVLDYTEGVHAVGVILLTLLVPGHAVAAIKHHFWDRDDVFEGMLPEVQDTHWHPGGPRYSRQAAPAPPRPADG